MSDTLSLNKFDRVAWLVMIVIAAATLVIILRGDQVGLGVVNITPAPQSSGVSPRAQLRIRFDQPLDQASVNAAALAWTPSVAGEVRVEGDTLIFAPNAPLRPATEYSVELAPGLRSAQGRLLHEAVQLRFATGQTSILYSFVDANGKEQLALAAATLPEEGAAEGVRVDSPRQLTGTEFGVWDFAVDPNSGQIVYSLMTEAGTSDLWTLLPGAQDPFLLQACPEAACNSVAFSPDSQLLAFSQRNASDFGVPVVSPPRLYLLELATGTVAPVFADSQQLAFDPRWSADGAWLSYLSPDLGGVGAYHLENGTTRFYPTTTGEAAVWHPQRNELILSEMLSSEDYFEVHLILVDPLTETRQNLSRVQSASGGAEFYPVEDNSPAYSPDGEWIAFRRKELDGPRATLGKQLWLMRADGSEARPLTELPDVEHGLVQWSPDGRYLLYHRFPLRGPDVTIALWVLEVSNGQSWEVARPGQRPQWVP
jgi:dipeptidyl aminopeptidase/acylaminoacyl peptidase